MKTLKINKTLLNKISNYCEELNKKELYLLFNNHPKVYYKMEKKDILYFIKELIKCKKEYNLIYDNGQLIYDCLTYDYLRHNNNILESTYFNNEIMFKKINILLSYVMDTLI